jgi:hypothetical protein
MSKQKIVRWEIAFGITIVLPATPPAFLCHLSARDTRTGIVPHCWTAAPVCYVTVRSLNVM